MEFRILGPVAASGSHGEVPLGSPRHRVLLATLLLDPGRVVPVDRLVEAMWGDAPPSRAVEMLHVRISELRKLLRSGKQYGKPHRQQYGKPKLESHGGQRRAADCRCHPGRDGGGTHPAGCRLRPWALSDQS